MSIERVLTQIKDGPSSQWPQPMLVLVEGLDISRYYKFHQYHEHRPTNAGHLKKKANGDLDSSKKKLRKFVHTDDTKTPTGEVRISTTHK